MPALRMQCLLLLACSALAIAGPIPTSGALVHVLVNGVDLGSHKHESRMREYHQTLSANLAHPQVHSVHVLWERKIPRQWLAALPAPSLAKLVSTIDHGRIKFVDAVRYANQHLVGQVVLLTNADIQLDGSGFGTLTTDALPHNTVLVPQRSERPCVTQRSDGGPMCQCSDFAVGSMANCFDSYIFRAPLPRQLLLGGALDFQLGGQWGSENVWVAELRSAGVNVYTPPCNTFGLLHNHCTQSRPNQKSQSESDGHVQRRWNDTCFHTFCFNTCVAPRVPHDDRITQLCLNKPLCDKLHNEYFTDRAAGWYGPTFPDDRWCSMDVDAALRLDISERSLCLVQQCPDNWRVFGDHCRAPASYKGPCDAVSTFTPGSSGMAWDRADRKAWSIQCQASWISCTDPKHAEPKPTAQRVADDRMAGGSASATTGPSRPQDTRVEANSTSQADEGQTADVFNDPATDVFNDPALVSDL